MDRKTERIYVRPWGKPKEEIQMQHFAFKCDPEWVLKEAINYLKKRNLPFKNFLNNGSERPMSRAMFRAWMPEVSVYFDNPIWKEIKPI